MSRDSYLAMADMLNDIKLADFQCVDVINLWAWRRGILTHQTGLGKTVIMSAVIKGFHNQVPTRRFLFFVKKDQLIQTPASVEKWTGLKCLAVTAQSDEIYSKLINNNFSRYSVLFLTHDTLNNNDVMRLLFEYRKNYFGIIVDEAHELTNFLESSSAHMLRSLLRNFEVKYAMTATPITTKARQIVDLAHMMAPEEIPDVKLAISDVKRGKDIIQEIPRLFIGRTRKDLGIISNYRTHVHYVEPHEGQERAKGTHLFQELKGKGAVNQANELVSIIRGKDLSYERGLIYILNHEVREWVLPFLDRAGITYRCINGHTPSEERRQIVEDFAARKFNVIITSVTTALDLDCEYVVFYQFSADIKQMIGRSERGLNPKTLDIHFIFTRRTMEINRFIETIYKTSLLVQDVLKHDYSELIRVGRELQPI